MLIRFATSEDLDSIHHLAHKIWWDTYQNILPKDKIKFMLGQIYSLESLELQFEEGIIFIISESEEKPLGFASYSLTDPEQRAYKIHKLYLLPEEQGKGHGKQLLGFIKDDIISRGGKLIELNVNRNNPALDFYQKYGFQIYKEEDIPYFHYTLNDYILRMQL